MGNQEAVEADLSIAVLQAVDIHIQAALQQPFTSQSLSAQADQLQAHPRPLPQVPVSQPGARALQLATEPRAVANHKYQLLLLGRLVPSLDH